MSDRQVHAVTSLGAEVVRYDRSSKWYLETGFGRRRITLDAAVTLAVDGEVWFGLPGGRCFDAAVRKAVSALMIVVVVEGSAPQATLNQIVRTAKQHPGGHRLQVVAASGPEPRKLTLGPRWSVNASKGCLKALGEYGQVNEC